MDLERGRQRAHATFEQLIELTQARHGAIDDRHLGAEAGGHAGRMRADDAAAKHDDLGRTDAGNAAHQHASSAARATKGESCSFDRQASGNLAHGSEQRQAAGDVGDGLIGDGGGARSHEAARLLGIGSEMEVGEQDLVRLQAAVLDGLGLLDLHDQLGLGKHRFRIGNDAGAGLLVNGIVSKDAGAGAGLDDDLVALSRQLANRARHEADTKLIVLNFSRHTDAHLGLHAFPRSRVIRCQRFLSDTSRFSLHLQGGAQIICAYFQVGAEK